MNIKNVGFRIAALIAIVFTSLVWLAAPGDVKAHAALERSDPTANAILAAPPTQITLWFTEPLERSYSQAILYDQDGNEVEGIEPAPGQTDRDLQLVVTKPLSVGTYAVQWRTLSNADGHTAEGYFAFTVGTASDVRAVIPGDSGSSGGSSLFLQSLSRWSVFLSLALVIAIWPMWLFVIFPAIGGVLPGVAMVAKRARRFALWAVGFALLSGLFALLVQASDLQGGSLGARAIDTVTDTRYGQLWSIRTGLLLICGVFFFTNNWQLPDRRWRSLATCAVSPMLAVPVSLNSHASAGSAGRTTAIAFDVLHLLSASVWIGGLAALVILVVPALRGLHPRQQRQILTVLLPRFSFVALIAWAILGVTGIYSAWLQVGNLDGLLNTAYGTSLIIKLVLLLPILVLAAFNLLMVTRKMKGSTTNDETKQWLRRFSIAVACELILVILVLVAVGRLTSQQPARDVITLGAEQISVDMDLSGKPATFTLSPGIVGPNHYVVVVDGPMLPDGTESVMRLTYTGDQSIAQKEVKLERSGGNRFEAHGSELAISGDWSIQVIVRKVGDFTYSGSFEQNVTTEDNASTGPSPAWRFTTTSGILGLIMAVAGIAGIVLGLQTGNRSLRRESLSLGVVALLVSVVLFAGGRVDSAPPYSSLPNPVPITSQSVELGEAVYLSNCMTCHGAAGKGDGPAGAGLVPAPANLTGGHALAHRDGEYFGWIKDGKPNTGMPGFGSSLTDQQMWDVINYIRAEMQGAEVVGPTGTPLSATPIP